MGLIQRLKQLAGGETSSDHTPRLVRGAERRRHRRLQNVRLTIFINGKRYKTNDWSLGGFRVMAPGIDLTTNQHISGALHGPGLFDRGTYEAAIAWVADDGEFGAHFIDLSHQSFLAMSAAQI